MLFPKPPKSIRPLLFDGSQFDDLPSELPQPSGEDAGRKSVMTIPLEGTVELKQDLRKLIRRLSTLCLLATSVLTAAVALWLIRLIQRF